MSVVDRFQRALTDWADSDEAGPARLPIRLTKACVQVLPITGAGLSLFSAPTMRIPIGASDDTATAAERAQFTVAQGPCFDAHQTGGQVVAPESVIAQRWPLFYDLIVQMPVRGILSCPLLDGLFRVGVLDLYVAPVRGSRRYPWSRDRRNRRAHHRRLDAGRDFPELPQWPTLGRAAVVDQPGRHRPDLRLDGHGHGHRRDGLSTR